MSEMNVFKSEIGTEINIDAIISVSPMCDAYGATIQENGKIYNSWYRICVEDKTRDAWGGYGDGNAGWITFDDFARLKPLLVSRGWSFGPYTYRGAWLVRGERGARPNSETTEKAASTQSKGDAKYGEAFRLLSSIMMPWSGAPRSGEDVVLHLWSACTAGDILVVKSELDRGASINIRLNPDGDTLLTKSIMCAQSELACWLLDHGADPELGLYNGRTPLMTAAGCGNLRVVEKLVDFGVHVNKQMNNGATALMYAVSKNQLLVARFLIRSGASRTLRDNEGWSIEDFARRSGVDISCLYN